MTDSMTKSFNNLKITATPALSMPPMQLTIPNRETRGRLMFYGFETTEEWLRDHAIKHRDAYGVPAVKYGFVNLSHALYILQRQTGIHQLKFKTVFAQNMPLPLPPKPGERSGPLREPGPLIVAVCSNTKASFHKRPSQAQVDHLKSILGTEQEPMWWINDSAIE